MGGRPDGAQTQKLVAKYAGVKGLTIRDVVMELRRTGYSVAAFKGITIHEITDHDSPLIAFVRRGEGHFTVVDRIYKSEVGIFEGGAYYRIPVQEFEAAFTGMGIMLTNGNVSGNVRPMLRADWHRNIDLTTASPSLSITTLLTNCGTTQCRVLKVLASPGVIANCVKACIPVSGVAAVNIQTSTRAMFKGPGTRNWRVTVFTDDPRRPLSLLTMTVHVADALVVPETIYLGRGTRSSLASMQPSLTVVYDPRVVISRIRASSSLGILETPEATRSTTALQVRQIKMVIRPDVPQGALVGWVDIRATQRGSPFAENKRVKVLAEILPPLQATPSVLFLGDVPRSQTMQLSLRAHTDSGVPLKIRKFQTHDDLQILATEQVKDNECVITVEWRGSHMLGVHRPELVIIPDSCDLNICKVTSFVNVY